MSKAWVSNIEYDYVFHYIIITIMSLSLLLRPEEETTILLILMAANKVLVIIDLIFYHKILVIIDLMCYHITSRSVVICDVMCC